MTSARLFPPPMAAVDIQGILPPKPMSANSTKKKKKKPSKLTQFDVEGDALRCRAAGLPTSTRSCPSMPVRAVFRPVKIWPRAPRRFAGANPLDPDVVAAGRFTTTQIHILAENQRKRMALARAKAELFKVAKEHQQLQENHQKDLDEQYQALEYLHWDNQRKAEEIEELQARSSRGVGPWTRTWLL